MAEACHGLIDGKEYNLIIGSSFRQKQNDGFYHSVRYDFKPASVDSSKPSELSVGSKNDITVKVPNVQESESTVFKGSKRPCTKECILIIDRETGEVKLERLASNIQLKKIRSQNSATAKTVNQSSQPPVAKISSKPAVHKHRIASKGEDNSKPKERPAEKQTSASKPMGPTHVANKPSRKNSSTSSSSHGSNSDSSSSGSDSDPDQDDSETEEQAKALDEALMQEPSENKRGINLIDEDLHLSDSDSD